jgi:hypothetical protein
MLAQDTVQLWAVVNKILNHKVKYCNGFAQSVTKQRLGKQTSTERPFSIWSTQRSLLRNAEVNTSLRQLVDTQQ